MNTKIKKTILLVGEKGLVGSAFRNLFENEYHIIGISSENKDLLFSISKPIDAIVFLAQSADYKSAVLTTNLFDINIKLLFECLDFYKEKVTNLIFFSSGSVYKLNTNKVINENSDLNIEIPNPYVATKLAAELILTSYKSFFESIIIVRPFFIYGIQQKENMLIKSLFKNILANHPIKLSGPKGLIFNPIHADDVANFIDYFLKSPLPGLKTFNLAGPEVCSLHDIAKILLEFCNSTSTIEITGNEDTMMVANVDIPGWNSKIGIKEGLEKTFKKNV